MTKKLINYCYEKPHLWTNNCLKSTITVINYFVSGTEDNGKLTTNHLCGILLSFFFFQPLTLATID